MRNLKAPQAGNLADHADRFEAGAPGGRRRRAGIDPPAVRESAGCADRAGLGPARADDRLRYERKGLLVEPAALDQAEQECLSDEEARARRRVRDGERREVADEKFQQELADEIVRLFPACPAERATAISRHTSTRGSGRVGRSAAGRALDPDAVTRAVVASVRHEDTAYDELLMSGVARDEARERIRTGIDQVLDRWRHSA